MKNCDAHGALYETEKALRPDEGYLISAAYIKQSSIYNQFLEQARPMVESLGITMTEYRAQMDSIQGDGPWMLCEDCIKALHLSPADLAAAREAGKRWETDKSTPGITPGQSAALKRKPAKQAARKQTTAEPKSKLIIDIVLLASFLFLELLQTILLLFTQNQAVIVVLGSIISVSVIFSCFILVRRHWLAGLGYFIIPELFLFGLSFIGWIINDFDLQIIYFFFPVVTIGVRLVMVGIGKKLLRSQEKPFSYLKEFLFSILIFVISYVAVYVITNTFHFYVFVIDISLLLSWLIVLFIYASAAGSKVEAVDLPGSFPSAPVQRSKPYSSGQEGPGLVRAEDAQNIMSQLLNSDRKDTKQSKPYSSMTEEEMFSGSDEEALKKVFGRLMGE